MECNASGGGPNSITVPAGTYLLTLGPADDEFNFDGAEDSFGDLDIFLNDLTITGAGAGSTIIDAGAIDRVFDINNFSAFANSVNVTLQGLTIRGGNAVTTPEGYHKPGGGIQFDGTDNNTGLPTGSLTVTNCVITNNTASGSGGGILSIFGSLSVTGSTISTNSTVNASGGGILFDGSSAAGLRNLQVTNNTITGNQAANGTFGNGGGILGTGNASKTISYNVITNNSAGVRGGGVNNTSDLVLTFNVIVGNSAGVAASNGLQSNLGSVTSDNDWWGCNQGPSTTPCDRAAGPLGFGVTQWLTLNHTATPNTIQVTQSTTLQADFFTNNLASSIAPSDLVALNGRAVTFNNPVLGTISGADPTISGGKANATFTAGAVGGSGSADATVDHATVTASITIEQPAMVTTNPTDQTVCDGSSVSFTASASGSPTPTVQWQVSTGGPFTNIPGATSTTLTFIAVAAQNGNQYRAVFTNTGGTATTTAATLTVNTAPTVTTNPTNQTVCDGATATFTAAASGSPAPTVQWQVSTGGPFSNIPGATSTTLSFTASAAQNGNTYRAVFTNSCGSTNSTAATLTVNASTATSDPADQTVCQGATANFSTTASGTGPFTYAWTVDGVTFGGNTASISVPTGSLTVGNHTVAVTTTGTCGSASQSATLTVQENTATTDPPDQTVCQGATANFSTTASGTGPFTYAWTLDGIAFGGNTSSINVPTGSLTVGNHTVAVTTTGTCGSASQSATLTVNENTATTDPPDQTVCQGATASFSTTASGTGPFTYAWTVDGSPAGGNSSSLSVPTGSLSIGNHTVAVTVTGTCGSASQSATLTVNANTATTDPPDQTVCQGTTASFSTTASGTGPFTYAWTVDGVAFGGNTSSISVPTGSLTIGNHTVAVTTTGTCGSASQSATLTVNANTATTDPPDKTVCQGVSASFSTTASGTGPFHYAWTVDGSAFGGDTSSISVPTGSLSVGNHTVVVTTNGACGSASQSATLTVQPPTSATTPANQAVCQGGTASFATTASGTGPFTYQWKLDGSNIAGATGSSVNINTTSLSGGNHTVDVVVSGACSTVTRSAILTVNTAPAVTTNPVSQTATSGTVTFTAAASGIPAPTVQWQVSTDGGVNFNNIPGETSTSLTVAATPANNGNKYRAVFTNGCGTATTTAATLTTCQADLTKTVGLNSVTVSGSGLIDSYSSAGGYPATKGSASNVVSNGTITMGNSGKIAGSGRSTQVGINMSGATNITGNATAGTTVSLSGSATVGGVITNNSPASVIMLPSVIPCGSYSSGSGISGTYSYSSVTGNLTLSGTNVATLANGSYCFNNITLTNSAQLKVNGPVVIRLTGTLNASGASSINNTTAIPANLRILSSYTGSNGVSLTNAANTYMVVYAPQTNVSVSGNAPLFGAVVGKTLSVTNSGAVHFDITVQNSWPEWCTLSNP
jgi:hypothetical protein